VGLRTGIEHISHLPRYREVANILIKHGFGWVFDRFPIHKPYGKKKTSMLNKELHGPSTAKRLRIALEELGPTYIKIGQLLSTRPDILSPVYINELEKLQNDVPPFSFDILQEVLLGEGINPADFVYIDPEPLAAASIAQVHRATLKTEERVVIKVRRPGISKIVATDLEILYELSKLAEKRSNWGRFYKLSEVVEELAEALRNGLDFCREARNCAAFYENFARDRNVLIPRVFWDYSSEKVLILEELEGIKISDFSALKMAGCNSQKIAANLIDALFKQVYEYGFFHADPHPGNIAVSEGEKLIFYDFGQVGIVDQRSREKAINLLIGMMRYDVNAVSRALLDIAIGSQHINKEEFQRDVSRLQQKYYGLPLSEIKVGTALSELIDLSMKHQMRLPAELSLLVKMLMTVEGLITQLDPQISIVDMAEPYGRKLLINRFSRERLKKDIGELLLDYLALFRALPRELDNILKLIEAGELKVRMEHYNLQRLNARLDIVSNRLSIAIIIASIIIGTSLVVEKAGSTFLTRLPLVEIGFLTAVVLGLFLIYSLIKSGRY